MAFKDCYVNEFAVEEECPFRRDSIYILDGGIASTISGYLDSDTSSSEVSYSSLAMATDPLFSSRLTHTNPDLVQRAHEDFLRAGARIITTNTYQLSPELFMKHVKDLEDPMLDSLKIFGRAVECADKAVEAVFGRYCPRSAASVMVAGSIGPYGACLADGSEYTGAYLDRVGAAELQGWHFERMKRLAAAGVDFFAVETIPSVVEALAILDTLAQFPGMKCWISFQCRDAEHTARGERFDGVIRQLFNHPSFPSRLFAVGVNCTDPRNVAPLLKLANTVNTWQAWPDSIKFVRLPYVVYPNSGEEWDCKSKQWSGEMDEEAFLSSIKEWLELGANVIGGCCRVGPDMISKIKDRVSDVLLDALEGRAKHEVRDNRDDWSEVEKRLKRPETEKRKKKKKKRGGDDGESEDVVKTEISSPFDLAPILAVPGIQSKEAAEKHLQAICSFLNVDAPIDSVLKTSTAGGENNMEAT